MDSLTTASTEPILRIVAAGVLGAIIGIDREFHGKPLGFRTLSVVSIASCALTVAAAQYDLDMEAAGAETVGRAAQGLMAGIGFLGGGVILHSQSNRVHGLTTAALVWLTAALGIICGLGLWVVVITAAVMAMSLLWIGGPLERALHRRRAKKAVRIIDP